MSPWVGALLARSCAACSLLGVSGAGVYLTGAIKDYVAVPRPLCPPLRRRISLGSHHEEYGMPSTHSANAVAMALVLFKAWARATGEPDTWRDLLLAVVVPLSLILYAASVVIGRVVCGMHSIQVCAFLLALRLYADKRQDIAAGSLLGWLIFVGNEGVRHAFSDCSPWVSRLLALPVVVAAAKLHPGTLRHSSARTIRSQCEQQSPSRHAHASTTL